MTMCAIEQNFVDLDARKALGRSHLEGDRIEEAIQVYARILRDYPDDIESYIILGDCYLADADANAALLLYSQALEHDPENAEIHRRVRLARNE
jgi:tetratricopeptide (TPR) repeat protein